LKTYYTLLIASLAALAIGIFVAMLPVCISSTEIRERLGRGESVEGLTPESVVAYIKEKGLYGSQ